MDPLQILSLTLHRYLHSFPLIEAALAQALPLLNTAILIVGYHGIELELKALLIKFHNYQLIRALLNLARELVGLQLVIFMIIMYLLSICLARLCWSSWITITACTHILEFTRFNLVFFYYYNYYIFFNNFSNFAFFIVNQFFLLLEQT